MSDNLYLRGKIWWCKFEVAGKSYRRSLFTSNRREAERRRDEERAKIEQARYYGEASHSYKEAVVKFHKEFLPVSVDESTSKRYACSLRQIGPYFEEFKDVREIKVRDVSKLVSARLKEGSTNATIRRDLTAGSVLFRCCVGWGWTEENPFKAFDRAIIREKAFRPDLPTHLNIAHVVQNVPENMGKLILTLFQTGMRLEESGPLTHPQIDWKKNEATLQETKNDTPRHVPLSASVIQTIGSIMRYVGESGPSPYVFWHDLGQRYLNLSSRLALLIGKATKTHFRVHDLRHRFAVDWIERRKALGQSVDIYELQKILGHNSVKTTERYLKFRLLPEEWPFGKSLHDMSYAEVMKLDLKKQAPAQNPAQMQRFIAE